MQVGSMVTGGGAARASGMCCPGPSVTTGQVFAAAAPGGTAATPECSPPAPSEPSSGPPRFRRLVRRVSTGRWVSCAACHLALRLLPCKKEAVLLLHTAGSMSLSG